MSNPYESDLELAIRAARAAGESIMRAFRVEQEVRYKSADQPVTEVRVATEGRALSANPRALRVMVRQSLFRRVELMSLGRYAALAALDAGCDLALLCNQSLDGGAALDELIDGVSRAQIEGRWQPSDVSEERRLALLPRTPALPWDALMTQPAYMQALWRLP